MSHKMSLGEQDPFKDRSNVDHVCTDLITRYIEVKGYKNRNEVISSYNSC